MSLVSHQVLYVQVGPQELRGGESPAPRRCSLALTPLQLKNKDDRTIVRRLLRRAIATQAHTGALPAKHLEMNIEAQEMAIQCLEYTDPAKKAACLRQGPVNDDSDSELE